MLLTTVFRRCSFCLNYLVCVIWHINWITILRLSLKNELLVKSKLFKVPQSLIHRAIVESACKVHAYNVTNIYKLLTIFSNVVLHFFLPFRYLFQFVKDRIWQNSVREGSPPWFLRAYCWKLVTNQFGNIKTSTSVNDAITLHLIYQWILI